MRKAGNKQETKQKTKERNMKNLKVMTASEDEKEQCRKGGHRKKGYWK